MNLGVRKQTSAKAGAPQQRGASGGRGGTHPGVVAPAADLLSLERVMVGDATGLEEQPCCSDGQRRTRRNASRAGVGGVTATPAADVKGTFQLKGAHTGLQWFAVCTLLGHLCFVAQYNYSK